MSGTGGWKIWTVVAESINSRRSSLGHQVSIMRRSDGTKPPAKSTRRTIASKPYSKMSCMNLNKPLLVNLPPSCARCAEEDPTTRASRRCGETEIFEWPGNASYYCNYLGSWTSCTEYGVHTSHHRWRRTKLREACRTGGAVCFTFIQHQMRPMQIGRMASILKMEQNKTKAKHPN